MALVRDALKALFGQIAGIYFRTIEVAGEVPAPAAQGRVFGANHVNALVDPVLVMTRAPCAMSPIAKSTLWKIPGLAWLLDAADAVPVIRRTDDPSKAGGSNDALFDRIAEHLGRGGNVLIFPEGTSHNEPHLVEVRTGPARMLARAHAAGARGLTFQSVGLEFDARDTFRSRALVLYGPVREVDALGLSGEALVRAITEQFREDLGSLVVEGDSWEDRLLIARVAELLAHEGGDASLAGWNEVGRQVEAARRALTPDDHALYREVGDAVSHYYAQLASARLRDADVATGTRPTGNRARERAWLFALAPLALPGAVLYWLPYQLPRFLARRLRASTDSASTYKLGAGLVVFPLWAALLTGASLALLPVPWSLLGVLVAIAGPLAALRWIDELDRNPGRRVFAADAPSLRELQATRAAVMDTIARARAKLGR